MILRSKRPSSVILLLKRYLQKCLYLAHSDKLILNLGWSTSFAGSMDNCCQPHCFQMSSLREKKHGRAYTEGLTHTAQRSKPWAPPTQYSGSTGTCRLHEGPLSQPYKDLTCSLRPRSLKVFWCLGVRNLNTFEGLALSSFPSLGNHMCCPTPLQYVNY